MRTVFEMHKTIQILAAATVVAAGMSGSVAAQPDSPEMMDTANGSCLVGKENGDVELYRMSCEEYVAAGAGATPDEVSLNSSVPEETAESAAD